jgi:hypothetical protein
MKNTLTTLTFAAVLFLTVSAIAADKVVVIPLIRCSDGLNNCSGQCVDTTNNPKYCGDCTTKCDPAGYCKDGTCMKLLGDICTADTECVSSHCVDGVCCDTSCSSLCEACIASKTGGNDGECGKIVKATDPDNECPGTDSCNGAGCCEVTIVNMSQYQGLWDAKVNFPFLVSGGAGYDMGDYYYVGVAGTTNIDGENNWAVGDYIIKDDSSWIKIANCVQK